MGHTIVEKILGGHAGRPVKPGDVVDVVIDARLARDFGGANVVRHLERHGLSIADAERTSFTFDCNPTGSDQRYAANQHRCRLFARAHGVSVHDIDAGIGTHLAMERGLAVCGQTLVSTDSHANILGAIGAFGQGMGDQDIAYAFAHGKVWFEVPPTVRLVLEGQPGPEATAKDITLATLRKLGAAGLLGVAAEVYGPVAGGLSVDERITFASMCTEMGGIIALIPPNDEVVTFCSEAAGRPVQPVLADEDATYLKEIRIDLTGLGPLVARPGHPDDVVDLADQAGEPIDSAFIGSCTNGRLSDLRAAAEVLRGRHVAPGVVLKVVPATNEIWEQALAEGIIATLKGAGALIGNAGCAGCAAGQIGQNGPGEVTVSTGNRNYPGKQGQGKVYLASPATVAAAAIAGRLASAAQVRDGALPELKAAATVEAPAAKPAADAGPERPIRVRGRVWVLRQDNVDTDMIFHNRHLTVTDPAKMGAYALGNLPGWEEFPKQVRPGDILVVGGNFGCGSSRQQAVDCFASLGIAAVVAESYGAIYERNGINGGMPLMRAPVLSELPQLANGDELELDFATGAVTLSKGDKDVKGKPFSAVQLRIYKDGGLFG